MCVLKVYLIVANLTKISHRFHRSCLVMKYLLCRFETSGKIRHGKNIRPFDSCKIILVVVMLVLIRLEDMMVTMMILNQKRRIQWLLII